MQSFFIFMEVMEVNFLGTKVEIYALIFTESLCFSRSKSYADHAFSSRHKSPGIRTSSIQTAKNGPKVSHRSSQIVPPCKR